MERHYFVCSVGQKQDDPEDDYIDANLQRCKKWSGHFMHPDAKQKGPFQKIKKGDIIFLRYKDKLVAFGEVRDTDTSNNGKLDGWNVATYVYKWHFYSDTITEGVDRSGISEAIVEGSQMATIKQVTSEYGLIIMNRINPCCNILAIIKTENEMNDTYKLLKNNHNIILTGAPGTGKTYLAQQIAQQMIFGEVKENMTDEEQKQFNEQCGFVQFHPSYDYTDFVEGLRPINDENGNIGFERKDGVFKEFCKKAIEKYDTANFDSAYDKMLEDIGEDEISLNTPKGNVFHVSVNSQGNLKLLTGQEHNNNGVLTRDKLKSQFSGNKEFKGWEGYSQGVLTYLKSKCGLTSVNKEGNLNYVFIIDEINRGEISKIFGEVFFSIDPGYRGEMGQVMTQYNNLIEEGDAFKNGFYVPENVYIIGTMNDIDRSVESMDFAMRRRFAWKEITAESRQVMLDEEINGDIAKKAKNRMTHLNESIADIEGLSTAYHIGPAYFLKLKKYLSDNNELKDDSWKLLWENHLKGLLCEYLRGMPEADKKLEILKAAYNDESDSSKG